ncbi:MAG: hypothetical protein J1D88_09475 [Treponema sp.]|nr:hypothetical protein [Treponema sp.]
MPRPQTEKPVLYSAMEVAHLCGVVNQTAINWIRNKYIKAFQTPGGQFRVYPDDLFTFMNLRGMRIPESLRAQIAPKHASKIPDDHSAVIPKASPLTAELVIAASEGLCAVLSQFLQAQLACLPVYTTTSLFEAGMLFATTQPRCMILDFSGTAAQSNQDWHFIYKTVSKHSSKTSLIVLEEASQLQGHEQPAPGGTTVLEKPIHLDALCALVKKAMQKKTKPTK